MKRLLFFCAMKFDGVLAHEHIVIALFFIASDEGERNSLIAAPGKIS